MTLRRAGVKRGAAAASWVGFEELEAFSAASFARSLLLKNDAAMASEGMWVYDQSCKSFCTRCRTSEEGCGVLSVTLYTKVETAMVGTTLVALESLGDEYSPAGNELTRVWAQG